MSEGTSSGADPRIGMVVKNRFEIDGVLGEGGMGKVYSAQDRETGGMAALKVVHGQLSQNDEYVQRLKQEARTAGRLRHEAAVRILAHGETDDGEPFLAMEYCKGVTLKDLMAKEKHLSVNRACNILAQILGAVGAAHKQGIVHRDLKPENIKIAPDSIRGEAVKVLDFGVAKFVGGDAPDMENAVKTKTGIILGTPKYMAPEQIRGEQVDGRSDIYSCGAMLYEMLAGTPPFVAEDVFGYVSKHLKEPPMPLSEKVPEYAIPQELDNLVMWLLEKNPVQRPQNAEMVITQLDKYSSASSSARIKFATRVAASWLIPGIASAAAIFALIPSEVGVEVAREGADPLNFDYSLRLLKLHGIVGALALAIGGTVGVLFQPRLSVTAYVKRLAVVLAVLAGCQALAVVALGGAFFAAAGFTLTAALIYVAFVLAWPMDSKPVQFAWTAIVAPVVAFLLNPVPLEVWVDVEAADGTISQTARDFFEPFWQTELWQAPEGVLSIGLSSVVAVLVMGIAFGLGTLFLPKPGRGQI